MGCKVGLRVRVLRLATVVGLGLGSASLAAAAEAPTAPDAAVEPPQVSPEPEPLAPGITINVNKGSPAEEGEGLVMRAGLSLNEHYFAPSRIKDASLWTSALKQIQIQVPELTIDTAAKPGFVVASFLFRRPEASSRSRFAVY